MNPSSQEMCFSFLYISHCMYRILLGLTKPIRPNFQLLTSSAQEEGLSLKDHF